MQSFSKTRKEKERERDKSFLEFPCVLRGCFSESSVLRESGSELLANGSQMAPKIHSKWIPEVPNGSQDPLKMGPRMPPGDLQNTIQKKGP